MAVAVDQFVVRAVDENSVIDGFVIRIKFGAFDQADDKTFIQNRAAGTQKLAVFTAQLQAQAVLADGGDGWNIGYGEGVFAFFRLAGGKGDKRAGYQRAQAGNAALVDARFHYPELGVFTHHVFGIGIEAGGDFYAFSIVAQADAGNAANIDAEYFNHGGVHFDAIGAVHQQGDFGAGIADFLEQQPAADHQSGKRNQPHHRSEGAGFAHAGGYRLRGGRRSRGAHKRSIMRFALLVDGFIP